MCCHSRQRAKLSVLSVLWFLFLYYGVSNVRCSTVHENNQDLRSLLEFKQGVVSDPSGALSNWNTSTHFCHWHGVNCTLTRPWRVRELNLPGQNLAGRISPSLGNLTFLNKLNLSLNYFDGPIPLLNVLQHLQKLNLGSNILQGVIPIGLTNCSSLSKLVLYGNNLTETQGFSESNIIGRGRYGTVYRARLKESKMEVAVKVFNLEMRGAERSFLSECEALSRIQHRNLLPIVTACSSVDNAGNDFKALAYELMPNGNLDSWLHHKGGEEASERCLGLTQRISIAVNIADALDYLHHHCGRPTVHCDLKPSNILLDGDMNALLGDFGIARFYTDLQSTWAGSTSSVGVKGTIGYIPPEYGGGGHVSTSGDVYSYGILLLEMLTGKRPTDSMFVDGLDIIRFVENNLPDRIFHVVVDAYLAEECMNLTQERKVSENDIYQCLAALLQIALSCTRSLPSERLNMKQVANKMHAIKASHLGWLPPWPLGVG